MKCGNEEVRIFGRSQNLLQQILPNGDTVDDVFHAKISGETDCALVVFVLKMIEGKKENDPKGEDAHNENS